MLRHEPLAASPWTEELLDNGNRRFSRYGVDYNTTNTTTREPFVCTHLVDRLLQRLLLELVDRLLAALGVAAGEGDLPAHLRELPRCNITDTGVGSGDDKVFPSLVLGDCLYLRGR